MLRSILELLVSFAACGPAPAPVRSPSQNAALGPVALHGDRFEVP